MPASIEELVLPPLFLRLILPFGPFLRVTFVVVLSHSCADSNEGDDVINEYSGDDNNDYDVVQ